MDEGYLDHLQRKQRMLELVLLEFLKPAGQDDQKNRNPPGHIKLLAVK